MPDLHVVDAFVTFRVLRNQKKPPTSSAIPHFAEARTSRNALRSNTVIAYETSTRATNLRPDRKAMSVRIQFDKPNACHTNLDFVTGRVILILQSDTTLQAITVKLEGESKTRLAGVRSTNAERNDKQKIEIETHKVRKWCDWGILSITE